MGRHKQNRLVRPGGGHSGKKRLVTVANPVPFEICIHANQSRDAKVTINKGLIEVLDTRLVVA